MLLVKHLEYLFVLDKYKVLLFYWFMFLVFRMCLDVLTGGQTLQIRKSNA